MPIVNEIPTSRNGNSDGSLERTWRVEGTNDDVEAEALAVALAPTTYRGLPRHPIPDQRNVARKIFEFTYHYRVAVGESDENEPQGDLPTIGKLSVKPIGGTQHITQCLRQTGYSGGAKTEDIEKAKVIGLHKDGVAGCDIDKPGSIITLEKLWLPAAITGEYIGKLERLKGKTNTEPYTMRWGLKGTKYALEYEPLELLFAGAEMSTTLTPRGVTAWSFVYTWLHYPNRENVQFNTYSQPIIVGFIGGHDYVWVMYEKADLPGEIKATIEVPKAVFVSKVHESANYVEQLGF